MTQARFENFLKCIPRDTSSTGKPLLNAHREGQGHRQRTADEEAATAAGAAGAHVAFDAAHLNAMAKVLCSKHEQADNNGQDEDED